MKYLIRLDDACEYMDVQKWHTMENLLDKYDIKPIAGIIPKCGDEKFIDKYEFNSGFWGKVDSWINKGWNIALHGYDHKYITSNGGINPVWKKSEFAGLSYESQKNKIAEGIKIFTSHNISPKIFFAPAHTFDKNTIKALLECSDIRIISDMYASDIYFKHNMFFIPVESLVENNKSLFKPLKNFVKLSTHVYHPNTMDKISFAKLENFIESKKDKFITFDELEMIKRKRSVIDILISFEIYSYLYIKGRRKKI